MRRLVLGTAGHIDHGKTALVKTLTGIDTDRLKEEKERGITVDLGFASFSPGEGIHLGVVDVPGHEGFIRNMVAGATGVDMVLLVVAADEGVMPQTREHLAIVTYLGVPELVVALTKADMVDAEWMELVRDDVGELLASTPFAEAPVLPVSAVSGEGIADLTSALADVGARARIRGENDVARLPVDRVFTIRGTGTVTTGTLWSGKLTPGDRVQILPGEGEGRIRGIQMHGAPVEEARAGARVAVSLTGPGVGREEVSRGQTLVGDPGWRSSWMLTCRLSVLEGRGWEVEQGQRVRVHLGTAEVLARVAVLQGERLREGEGGWVQLRLEEPLLARVRDHLVIRSYSPVTTIGGGRVAEVTSGKRRRLDSGEAELLETRLDGSVAEAVGAFLENTEWEGAAPESLPQQTGFPPGEIHGALGPLLEEGRAYQANGRLFAGQIRRRTREMLLEALGGFHEGWPLRQGMPLEELRQVVPGPMGERLAEGGLKELMEEGRIRREGGWAALAGFRIELSADQEALREDLRKQLARGGLAPPTIRELKEGVADASALEPVLQIMEEEGEVIILENELAFAAPAVREGGEAVIEALAGAEELGPADFREVLDLTRKHLLPLLRYFDTAGITTRLKETRRVAKTVPEGWGTTGGREA